MAEHLDVQTMTPAPVAAFPNERREGTVQMDASFDNSLEGLRVGPDKVRWFGESVIIHATREMPDWQVREFCKIPIYFDGRKYYLKRKLRLERPYAMSYELDPWPEDLHEESKLDITYDEQYVAWRDRLIQTDKWNDLGRALLLPFFPFLGFLWSRFKDHKLERFGLNPLSMTLASVLLEFALVVIEVIFLFIFHYGFAQVVFGLDTAWLDCTLFVMMLIDTIVRADQVLRGVDVPAGFLEWLVNFLVRTRRRHKDNSQNP